LGAKFQDGNCNVEWGGNGSRNKKFWVERGKNRLRLFGEEWVREIGKWRGDCWAMNEGALSSFGKRLLGEREKGERLVPAKVRLRGLLTKWGLEFSGGSS